MDDWYENLPGELGPTLDDEERMDLESFYRADAIELDPRLVEDEDSPSLFHLFE